MTENMTFERKFELDRKSVNIEARTVDASIASDTPIMHMYDGQQTAVTLRMSDEAVSLIRGNEIPLLWMHDPKQPIGVIRNFTYTDGKMRARLHFSNNSKAQEVLRDVNEGYLKDTSIKAIPIDWSETDGGLDVHRWMAEEGSVVTLGADESVGINRAKTEDKDMTDTTETQKGTETAGTSGVIDFEASRERNLAKGREEGAKIERKRVADLTETYQPYIGHDGVEDLLRSSIVDGLTPEMASKRLLRFMAGSPDNAPIGGDYEQSSNGMNERSVGGSWGQNTQGQQHNSKVMEQMEKVMLHRCQIEQMSAQDAAESDFMGMDTTGLAREYLRMHRVNLKGLDKNAIMGKALTRDITETAFNDDTSSWSDLLSNLANKSMAKGYDEAEESWQRWCAVGNLSDFKINTRVDLSTYPTPAVVAENDPFLIATVTDSAETISLLTHGSIFSVTRQALVNDDLSGLSRIPRAQGRACARAVGDSVYSTLTTIQTMGDTNPLFDAINHNNVIAAAGPDVATVDAIRVGMALQTDATGTALGIRPEYLICPVALEGVASTLRNAQFDPDTAEASGNTSGNRPNWVAGTFEVVPEHRLDATSATDWYMAASSTMYDTVEVAFLNGINAPQLESRDGFKIDGVEMRCRIDFGVAPLSWRTLFLAGTAPV